MLRRIMENKGISAADRIEDKQRKICEGLSEAIDVLDVVVAPEFHDSLIELDVDLYNWSLAAGFSPKLFVKSALSGERLGEYGIRRKNIRDALVAIYDLPNDRRVQIDYPPQKKRIGVKSLILYKDDEKMNSYIRRHFRPTLAFNYCP